MSYGPTVLVGPQAVSDTCHHPSLPAFLDRSRTNCCFSLYGQRKGGDDSSSLEVSSVEPTARDLESSAANWATGLNYKEFEDSRKWSFIIEVKKTHIHTFPPNSGKKQQVLLLRNLNKKLHKLELSRYYICCISKTQGIKSSSILQNAKEKGHFRK